LQLDAFLSESARRAPARVALVAGDRRLDYAELERLANRLAHVLVAAGVARGDRVLVQLENSVEAVVSVFAVLKAGAAFVMVNPGTKAGKLAYIASNCRAAAIVTDAAHQLAARQCLATETPIASVAGPGTVRALVLADEAIARPGVAETPPAVRAIDVDLAALVYTSGSTGGPKGVMLTHANMVAAATSIAQYLELRADDVILNVLPLSFDYGLYQALLACKLGATLVLERNFAYPAAMLERIAAERVTGLPIVPTMSALLLQLDLRRWDLSSLRFITNTGAVLPARHIAGLRSALPQARIYSMYGLTECKRVAYLPPEQVDQRPGSVGKAMPNTETWIVDDAGEKVGPGEVGELVVRGSNVMKGYWENPEATDRVLRPGPLPGEKVLYSGDLFRTDAEGYLYYVGRKDEIIKSRGEKVSPREVEEVLHAMPGIAEAAVIGVPDRILGTAVKAVIVARQGVTLTEREVLHHCRAYLEDFMLPKFVEFRASLPKSGNGKVAKKELQQPATEVAA
jgi:long-chain acyl-CoA synthetase